MRALFSSCLLRYWCAHCLISDCYVIDARTGWFLIVTLLIRALFNFWLLRYWCAHWLVSECYVKAMLHEAIFLATCLATMTTEKHCRLQRGCHTFAIFFRNLQRPRWKLFTTLSPPAWNLLRAKDGLWLPKLHKIASQVSMDMSHTGYFYFSCN